MFLLLSYSVMPGQSPGQPDISTWGRGLLLISQVYYVLPWTYSLWQWLVNPGNENSVLYFSRIKNSGAISALSSHSPHPVLQQNLENEGLDHFSCPALQPSSPSHCHFLTVFLISLSNISWVPTVCQVLQGGMYLIQWGMFSRTQQWRITDLELYPQKRLVGKLKSVPPFLWDFWAAWWFRS